MTTRVNLEIFVNTTLANIQQNMSNLNKLQEQISTGKKINRPSDEPAGAGNILRLRTEHLRLDQYASNIQTAKQSLDFNASVLQNASDILQRIRELTMHGVSGSVDQDGRNKIAAEINQLLESALQEANSALLGRYIFAGTKTTTLPFETIRSSNGQISEVNYKGNREKIEFRIGPGTNATVNQPGDEVFTDNGLFSSIIKIRDALSDGTVSLARDQLNNLDNASKGILNSIAKAGSISNTLELVDNKVADTKLSLQKILSSTESADLAELVLRLQEQENIFQASLAFSALVFKTSILDYL